MSKFMARAGIICYRNVAIVSWTNKGNLLDNHACFDWKRVERGINSMHR